MALPQKNKTVCRNINAFIVICVGVPLDVLLYNYYGTFGLYLSMACMNSIKTVHLLLVLYNTDWLKESVRIVHSNMNKNLEFKIVYESYVNTDKQNINTNINTNDLDLNDKSQMANFEKDKLDGKDKFTKQDGKMGAKNTDPN